MPKFADFAELSHSKISICRIVGGRRETQSFSPKLKSIGLGTREIVFADTIPTAARRFEPILARISF